MNKNTFKSLSDLSRAINDKTNLIENGKYSLKDIESGILDLNELHERLIVLKYKAIEQLANQNLDSVVHIADDEAEDRHSQQEMQKPEIKADVSNANQMTIMDGINEAEKELQVEEIESNFSPSESVAEHFHDQTESVAEKMENKSIDAIKSALSINQRFSFAKNLFNDDTAALNGMLDELDSCTSLDSAQKILSAADAKFGWDKENEVTQEFIELVNRRFA
ncbi:MAG: hypothetical protein AAF487_06390 [Bacteroidota bacterium]